MTVKIGGIEYPVGEVYGPFAAIVCHEGKMTPKLLEDFYEDAWADIAAQRQNEESAPLVPADVFAIVMERAIEEDQPKYLLSQGLELLFHHANHNAHGGYYGQVGAEIAAKIGYVPPETFPEAFSWTLSMQAITGMIARLTEILGYDPEMTAEYRRREKLAADWIDACLAEWNEKDRRQRRLRIEWAKQDGRIIKGRAIKKEE